MCELESDFRSILEPECDIKEEEELETQPGDKEMDVDGDNYLTPDVKLEPSDEEDAGKEPQVASVMVPSLKLEPVDKDCLYYVRSSGSCSQDGASEEAVPQDPLRDDGEESSRDISTQGDNFTFRQPREAPAAARVWTPSDHTDDVRGRSYKCEYCKRKFKRDYNLTIHMREHAGEDAHHCSLCERTFADMNALSAHVRSHPRERPYICDLCAKSFTNQSHFSKHMRLHSR